MAKKPKYIKKYFTKHGKETEDLEKAEKVVIELQGSEAAQATKVAKALSSAATEKKKFDNDVKKYGAQATEMIEAATDVADEAFTRVLQMSQMALALDKSAPTPKAQFDNEGFMKAVIEASGLAEDVIEELRAKFTTEVMKKRKPSVKAVPVESNLEESIWGKITGNVMKVLSVLGRSFTDSVKNFFNDTDQLMADMRKQLASYQKYESYQNYEKYLKDAGAF